MSISAGKIVGYIAFPTLVFSIAAGTVFLHYKPDAAANKYEVSLKADSRNLKKSFQVLGKTADDDVFQTPDVPPAEALKTYKDIQNKIVATRFATDDFSRRTASLQKVDHIKLSDSYTKALVLRDQAQEIVDQSRDILNKYQDTLNKLTALGMARANYEAATNYFNSYSNLNLLYARQAEFQAYLNRLTTAANELQTINPPFDLVPVKNNFATTVNQALTGYNTVAAGLRTQSDPLIDNGAKLIEASVNTYDTRDRNDFFEKTVSLSVLTDVANLPDKVEGFEDL